MSGQGIAQFIPLILIFVIFYFFLIRPQQKRVKDHKAMVESLKRGDELRLSLERALKFTLLDLQLQVCLRKKKLKNNFFLC